MSNTPQKPPRNLSSTSKTIAFWVLVLLVPVAFIQFSNARADARVELNVSQYEQQLDANNVAAINISSDRHVNGDFRQKVAVDGHSGKKFHVLLPGPLTERERDQLRANKVVVASSEAGQSFGTLLIAWLPVILIIAIWIFIFRQMQAGGNKAFSFGKSKAKLLSGDTPKITFADVAGCDEAKLDLREIIEFLKLQDLGPIEHGLHLIGDRARGPSGDLHLVLESGVADENLEHETVLLGLGEGVGSLLLQGILGGQNKERVVEAVPDPAHGDLAFLHRLQQSRLRFGRGAVDFVCEDDIREQRPFEEPEFTSPRVPVLLDDLRPGDVGGHQVGGELHARELEVHHVGERAREERLAHAGHALHQHVAAEQEPRGHALHGLFLTDHALAHLRGDALAERTDVLEGVQHVHLPIAAARARCHEGDAEPAQVARGRRTAEHCAGAAAHVLISAQSGHPGLKPAPTRATPPQCR